MSSVKASGPLKLFQLRSAIRSSFLFAVFGLKMLREGWKMSGSEAAEEMEEVQEDLKKKEAEAESDSSADVEGGS